MHARRTFFALLALVGCHKARLTGASAGADAGALHEASEAAARTGIGWELVPIEDGFGRPNATKLVLSTRETPPRELVNLGFRSGCGQVEPFEVPSEDGGWTDPSVSVLCTAPAYAFFHAAVAGVGVVRIVRTGCGDVSAKQCGSAERSTSFVGAETIAAPGLGPETATLAPLITRGRRVATGDGSSTVQLRWERGGPIYSLYAPPSDDLVLALHGAVEESIEFGPLGVCGVPVDVQLRARPAWFPPDALMPIHCYATAQGNNNLAVTRTADGFAIAHTGFEEMGTPFQPMRVTRRVALPPGATLDVQK